MKKLIGTITLLLLSFSIYAQRNEMVEIYFEQGGSVIDRDYSINDDMLNRLEEKLTRCVQDSTITIDKIMIESSTSPEGGLELNKNLSMRRTDAVCDYIRGLGLNIPDSLMHSENCGIAWDKMRRLVSVSDMADKDAIIKIIDEVPVETWAQSPTSKWSQLVDSRNKQLMDLNGGNPYHYMVDNIFPLLRKSSVVTIYFKKEPQPEPQPEPELEPEPETQSQPTSESTEAEIKPLLALKTNLLYDVVTALNVEVEVPIGQHWSIAGEWVFPWWSSSWDEDSGRNCFQLLNGNIEGKYWFGDRTDRPVMTGWHVGLYAGGGLYDLERNKEGYQGEFFIAAGLSGGYAHTINKSGSLRMEYSVAVGYLKTDYDKYTEHWGIDSSWHTLRQESGNYTWIGPTRARVSLVWMLNRKVNKEK